VATGNRFTAFSACRIFLLSEPFLFPFLNFFSEATRFFLLGAMIVLVGFFRSVKASSLLALQETSSALFPFLLLGPPFY